MHLVLRLLFANGLALNALTLREPWHGVCLLALLLYRLLLLLLLGLLGSSGFGKRFGTRLTFFMKSFEGQLRVKLLVPLTPNMCLICAV